MHINNIHTICTFDKYTHMNAQIVAFTGIITTIAGTGSVGSIGDRGLATSVALHHPRGIAVDTSGNIYIADTWNHKIRMVSIQVCANKIHTHTHYKRVYSYIVYIYGQ